MRLVKSFAQPRTSDSGCLDEVNDQLSEVCMHVLRQCMFMYYKITAAKLVSSRSLSLRITLSAIEDCWRTMIISCMQTTYGWYEIARGEITGTWLYLV